MTRRMTSAEALLARLDVDSGDESLCENVNAEEKRKAKHFTRPKGRAPLGFIWDHLRGEWLSEGDPAALRVTALRAAAEEAEKWRKAKLFPRPRGAAPGFSTWDYNVGKWVPPAHGVRARCAQSGRAPDIADGNGKQSREQTAGQCSVVRQP